MEIASRSNRFYSFAGRSAALAAFAVVSVAAASAQQVDFSKAAAAPATLVADASNAPLDLAHSSGVAYSSSASPELDAIDAAAAEKLDIEGLPSDATQPPPRRRYGRPRYNDSSHNPDGSPKYAFLAGVGFTLATGNTYHYLNTNYAFQVGAGRNFNKNFALIFQFDYDAFGFNGRTLNNESELYFGDTAYNTGTDGNSHIWSFTLNPTYNIYAREGVGAYVVGGVGFYHKVANFTTPQLVEGYGYYGEIEQYTENVNFAHFFSNAVGFNGGFGFTYKPSRFSGTRLYAEARYVFIDNQQRPGVTVANEATTTYTGTDGYPANSNRTTYIPIKFGIRF